MWIPRFSGVSVHPSAIPRGNGWTDGRRKGWAVAISFELSQKKRVMLKLYKLTDTGKYYWETWEDDGVHTVHWGELGTRGESKELKSTLLKKAETEIQAEIHRLVEQGYDEIEDEVILLIEYSVEGMGTGADVEKRARLQDRMSETLGWTGLGHCDGGSIGSGTMEVCCFVVDFEVAKAVIEADLKGTEFENHTRIYDEDQDG